METENKSQNREHHEAEETDNQEGIEDCKEWGYEDFNMLASNAAIISSNSDRLKETM